MAAVQGGGAGARAAQVRCACAALVQWAGVLRAHFAVAKGLRCATASLCCATPCLRLLCVS